MANMGAILRLLFATLVVLCFIRGGLGKQCGLSDIVVAQVKTGRVVEGKPEYQVVVSNKCNCPQSEIFVRCFGLSSVEPVDPRAIKPVDRERCIIAGGQSLVQGQQIRFNYAWLNPQDFPVVSSKVQC